MSRELEKEIGGQLELVRLQSGMIRRGIAKFNSMQPPLDVDELGVMTRGLRNFAREVDNLRRMLDEYPGFQKKNKTADT